MSSQMRVSAPQMMSKFNGGVWGMEQKLEVFKAWNPESARDYDNFNPFERNDEGSMCDTNGCFPGQSRGYSIPIRPDASWAIMQEENKVMDELKKDPKYNLSGKPGNWSPSWQAALGAPP
eukprot:6200882-Pleurochrysis_carterae.AAC.2